MAGDFALQESESLELKKGLGELKQGLISMVAILNQHGAGELWFGVKNDGMAVGLDVNEKTLRDLSQSIAANIEPRIFPRVGLENFQGRSCIRVRFRGKDSPYFAFGRAYVRVADEDRQLTVKELEHFILAKHRDAPRWDSEPSDLTVADIDKKRVGQFLKRAGIRSLPVRQSLEKLGIVVKDRITKAADLFFAREPSLTLRCAVFGGTSSSVILDRHDFVGDIPSLIEEALTYILEHIQIGMRVKGVYREDLPEISTEALREAVINAFCHRDYRDPDHVQIAVFKNRVEIRNPGELCEGLTIEKMREGNVSRRRNPLVADLLRRIRLVEAWGRGMSLMFEHEPRVLFSEVAGHFVTTFPRPSLGGREPTKSINVSEKMSEEVSEEMSEKVPRAASENASEKVFQQTLGKTPGKKVSEKTSEKILTTLRGEPRHTIAELVLLLGVSSRTIERHLRNLQRDGRLRREGPDKGGRWVVLP